MSHMFEVMTPENTATVSMNNPVTGCAQTVITGADVRSIAHAVVCFARMQGLHVATVEYSIVWPSSVSRETHTTQAAPTAPTTQALPDNVPPIGATVHIRTNGPRKRAVAHTIAGYDQSPDGTWTYKAYDFAGWAHIDTVDSLFT